MKEVILITGANGTIARYLSEMLSEKYSIRFLTREKKSDSDYLWNLKDKYIDVAAFKDVKHIIHLAGAGIGDERWTTKRKGDILSSRVETAQLILNILISHRIKIASFISASAVGYYGTKTTDVIFTESDKKGDDFLSDVCFEWEQIAKQFESNNVSQRVVILRFGIVLSEDRKGILQKMATLIGLNFGAYLGTGNQYIPWIHIYDLCSMIRFLMEEPTITGTFNAVSAQHITNKEFTDQIAHCKKKRVLLPNIPAFLIRFIFGERAILLLEGSRVSSEKIVNAGFDFKFSKLNNAVKNLMQ